MKNLIKRFLPAIICLVATVSAFAQSEQTTIKGTFTKKCNAEILLTCKIDGKSLRVAGYAMDTTSTKFCFGVPFRANASYQIQIVLMKKGHLRPEPGVKASFPLTLGANSNLTLTVDPLQLNEAKQTGLMVVQQQQKFQTASVSGSITNLNFGIEVNLEKVVEGNRQRIQSYFIEKGASSYNFLVPMETEGIYYLSVGVRGRRLYIKPNDKLELTIDLKMRDQVQWTRSTPENELFYQWQQLINTVQTMSFSIKPDEPLFTVAYQALQQKIPTFLLQAKTANTKFNAIFKTAVRLDNNLMALTMLINAQTRSARSIGLRYFLDVPAYYKQFIPENKVNTANVLQLDGGSQYINLYAKLALTGLESDAEKMKLMMGAIANDTLKARLLKSQLETVEGVIEVINYSEFCDVYLPFKKYATTASAKERYNAMQNKFAADTAFIGKSSYNFILPDVNGNMVSMKDFKGKVIFIDTWATWCGPCKAQIPFLLEIEKAYKGNDNIVFIGLSIDKETDRQKWLDMLKEKGLEGVQLLDNMGKSFARKYNITAIPRFLMIDKKGNWVEVNCALPDARNNKLKNYIDRVLAAQ
ncbi:MAG: TlpA disulfide reductase family protein [Mucilaginibacter sp.]|uniref:TlpA family protein disulfide reductase n=1 Tax=Mucilaginibacter sp. TaxID=1882438 RepID=UPI003267F14D